MRVGTSVRAATAVALVVSALAALSSGAAAEPGIASPQAMPPLIGGSTPPSSAYGAVSCATASSCTAVGPSILGVPSGRPTAVARSSATWGAPTAVALPPGAVLGGGAPPVLNAVSCPAIGACVAVGTFSTRLGAVYPMAATASGGSWHRATGLALPSEALAGGLEAVWCGAPTSCVALGYDATSATAVHAIAYTRSKGGWSAPTTLPAARSLGSGLVPVAIACTAVGACTALAVETSSSGAATATVAWRDEAGRWGAPERLSTAIHGTFVAVSVACPDAATCLAVGGVDHGASTVAASATSSAGTWSGAVRLATPRLSPRSPMGDLAGVSCAAGVCEAVGHFSSSTSPSSTGVAGAATWSAGRWSPISFATRVPAGAGEADDAAFTAVSCATPSACLAVGGGAIVPVPSHGPQRDYPFSASLATTRVPTAPSPPATVTVVPLLHGARVSWTPPTDDGGDVVTSFTATVAPGAVTCSSAGDACTVGGLRDGRRYTASVTASTDAGRSGPSHAVAFVAGAPPTAPTGVAVAAVGATLVVTWRAASAPAGEHVTRYVATAVAASETVGCSTTTLRCTVRGATRGRRYRVSVVADDASGSSRPSVPVVVTAR